MLTGRLDYNFSDDKKLFVRLGYDNANLVGPQNSQSIWRNQINVPSAAGGLDWNHGRFVNSARFGYQKLVNAITPDLADSASAPFHMQLGSVSLAQPQPVHARRCSRTCLLATTAAQYTR